MGLNKSIERIIRFQSAEVANARLGSLPEFLEYNVSKDLWELLSVCNGLYSFQSALLIRPWDFGGSPMGIAQWNRKPTWKEYYDVELQDIIFFGEDLFGGQFGIRENNIYYFDPENAEISEIANSLSEWAEWLLSDHKTITGWPLAEHWQKQNGVLVPGTRLLPKQPFVLGGLFTLENVQVVEDVVGMRVRADLANQLRNCAPGTKIVFRPPTSK